MAFKRVGAALALFTLVPITGCLGPQGPVVDCGPLSPAECEEQSDAAYAYVARNFGDEEIRSITFTEASGAYVISFANGDEAVVTP